MSKVLIVDDDPDFVTICRTVLVAEGYEVLEAANGQEALEVLRQDKPDLVLLDVMMSTTLEGVDVSREAAARSRAGSSSRYWLNTPGPLKADNSSKSSSKMGPVLSLRSRHPSQERQVQLWRSHKWLEPPIGLEPIT